MTEHIVRQPERRENWQMTCTTLCKPVAEAMDKLTEKIELKLAAIKQCLDKKVDQKTFVWLMSGLAFFTVIIIGGAQWAIVAQQGDIKAYTKGMAEKIIAIEEDVQDHKIRLRLMELKESGRHPEYYGRPKGP